MSHVVTHFYILPFHAILGNVKYRGKGSKNTKKMSYFSGSHNLVKLVAMIPILFFFFFFFSIIFLQTSSMAEEEIFNPLFGFSSREEMVQLAGYGEEKLSTVLVTGTVLCQACSHGEPYLRSWPISGALVSVHCNTGRKRSRTPTAQAVTDEYGDFLIDLPSHLHATPHLDRTCSVKVLRTPENSTCRPAYGRKNKALKLSSVGNGIRTYTAGNVKFLDSTSRPLQACSKTTSSDEQVAW